ncbi:competence protein ComGC [Gracilibacillus halotolerans]|uniref:ComG operon protein 3 n=1 Tax=Gracilibacillus halotolerans TaxID=74386 RepID=A0A841RKQ0_9BACI|nr:competence protein ComGC [Gracilibacillus halotolerans]
MINNDKGFTLIEMLIVLAVITILLVIMVPNLSSQNSEIQAKGCDALLSMVENQVLAYELDKGNKPQNLQLLVKEGYIKDLTCGNGAKQISIKSENPYELEIVDV